MRSLARHLALGVVAAGAVAACGTAVAPAAGGDLDGEWTLASGTLDGAPLALTDAAPVTLIIRGGEVSGRSACNSYTGALEVDGDAVTVTGVGGTDMGCEREVMALEMAYQQALGRVGSAAVAGDALTLAGNGVELAFEPGQPTQVVALIGTQWLLESLIEGSGADASVSSANRPAFLKLSDDGTFEGEGGCNHVWGSWKQSGDAIETAEMGVTEVGCGGDEAQLERQIFDVLAGPFTAVVEGDALTLTIADGRGLVYRPAP